MFLVASSMRHSTRFHRRLYGAHGPQPVTIGDMVLYCLGTGINDIDERLEFIRTMQRLDATYLAEVAKRNATSTGSEVVKSTDVPR